MRSADASTVNFSNAEEHRDIFLSFCNSTVHIATFNNIKITPWSRHCPMKLIIYNKIINVNIYPSATRCDVEATRTVPNLVI